MPNHRRKELTCHGVRILNSRHREVRRLKRLYRPYTYGHRVWTAGWLLVDYLNHRRLPTGRSVMEVGCGWGLPGIYCAKTYQASLTSVDVDWDVYPYHFLHADINNVESEFMSESFEDLRAKHFRQVDILLGSDICFGWPLVDELKSLIRRALAGGVKLVVMSDPGRPTFDRLGAFCEDKLHGRQFYWSSNQPYRMQGQILEIDRLKNTRTAR